MGHKWCVFLPLICLAIASCQLVPVCSISPGKPWCMTSFVLGCVQSCMGACILFYMNLFIMHRNTRRGGGGGSARDRLGGCSQ